MKWYGVLAALGLFCFGSIAVASNTSFTAWLDQLRRDALAQGIPQDVVTDALTDIEPDPDIIRLDRKQPEGTVSFTQYVDTVVTDVRVQKGRELLAQNRALLNEISAFYHVQPQYLVALWGIETNFGAHEGNYSLIQALATLAYDGRRADFFRKELLNALTILAQEHETSDALTGSWAGATGNCQFMPSTYLHYAVDWDHDGHRDIWNSLPDSFASMANYLHAIGWDGNLGWGMEVNLPEDFKPAEADLHAPHTMREWALRGVTLADGTKLTPSDAEAAIVTPGDPYEGAYLVTKNYSVLLQWNRSRYFATAVGLLADRIGGEE